MPSAGPTGPTGPAGPAGPTGPTGPAGPGPVIQSGVATFVSQNTIIPFPVPFDKPPIVFIQTTANDGGVDQILFIGTYNSTTQFHVFSNGTNGNIQFFWMAFIPE